VSIVDIWVFVGVTVYVGGLAFDIAASVEEKVTFLGTCISFGCVKFYYDLDECA